MISEFISLIYPKIFDYPIQYIIGYTSLSIRHHPLNSIK